MREISGENLVALVVAIAVFLVMPIFIFLLAWQGRIDLNRWLGRASTHSCPRCGSVRIGRYCGRCGQLQSGAFAESSPRAGR